ncbi:hypothetical protein DFH29DRAFT_944654 [Suillus ampliporus]|nr:hypothetical protein DFH29DRAFT_944654 [Suillus ampliporus]
MKRIQSRTASRRRSPSPNLSRRSTTPDLEVLHVHGEAYDEYECGESSSKRKRAVTGIRDVKKTTREILPFVRRRHSYECSYDEQPMQWSPGVKGLVDSQMDVAVDHKTTDVKDESCVQIPGSSISVGVPPESLIFRIFERMLASKKTTDPRRRPCPVVDIDMIDLPSASGHLPCRDMCGERPHYNKFTNEANESPEVIQASEPMQVETTDDLMREIFGDGEEDDRIFDVLQAIKHLRVM